jgi:MFS family permease
VALGLNGIAGNVGIAGAPIAAELLATGFGWRAAYLTLGVLVLVCGAAVSTLAIDEPAPGQELRDEHHHAGRERMVLFVMLLCAMTLGGLSYRANTVAQPAYYAERVSFVGYGVATSLVYTLSALGQYIGGRLADRYDLRWLYVAFHALSLPFVIGMAAATGLPLMVLASGFIFFSIGMQPIENSLVARFTPDRWRATGYGLKFTVVFGVGALAVPGVKYLMRAYSLSAVFVAVAVVVSGIVAVALLLAWRTRNAPIYNHPAEPASPAVAAVERAY